MPSAAHSGPAEFVCGLLVTDAAVLVVVEPEGSCAKSEEQRSIDV
jgi:hypothetical protein